MSLGDVAREQLAAGQPLSRTAEIDRFAAELMRRVGKLGFKCDDRDIQTGRNFAWVDITHSRGFELHAEVSESPRILRVDTKDAMASTRKWEHGGTIKLDPKGRSMMRAIIDFAALMDRWAEDTGIMAESTGMAATPSFVIPTCGKVRERTRRGQDMKRKSKKRIQEGLVESVAGWSQISSLATETEKTIQAAVSKIKTDPDAIESHLDGSGTAYDRGLNEVRSLITDLRNASQDWYKLSVASPLSEASALLSAAMKVYFGACVREKLRGSEVRESLELQESMDSSIRKFIDDAMEGGIFVVPRGEKPDDLEELRRQAESKFKQGIDNLQTAVIALKGRLEDAYIRRQVERYCEIALEGVVNIMEAEGFMESEEQMEEDLDAMDE